MKRGEIYWVKPLEEGKSVQTYDRPAVIVSNNFGNEFAPIVEVVYLSTARKKKLPTHVIIHSSLKTSIALCEQIATVPKERLNSYVGTCTEQEMLQINRAMLVSLGIIA